MKPSYYNTYIPLEDGSYLLHNKLTGALLTVDAETKEMIENIGERKEEIPEALLSMFVHNGVLVQNSEEQLLKIRYRYHEVCYNPQALSFVLAPTARCNLSCCYCIQRVDESLVERSSQTATMSDATVENTLSFVKSMAESCNAERIPVSFYGGEPLMARRQVLHILQDLSHYCEERSLTFKTTFTTNLTLLDQSFLEDVQTYSPLYFRTTFDGPEEVHNSFRHYRNGKGTYQDILTSIGKLMDAHIRVRAQININKYYMHVPELLDDLKERGLSDIVMELYALIDPFVTIQEAQKHYGILDKNFPLPESQFAIHFDEIVKAKTFVYRALYDRGFKLPSSLVESWAPCDGMCAHHFLVDPFGDVYKCVGSMLMKNLRVGFIGEKGHFERLPLFYRWIDSTDPTTIEKCQKCHLLPACGGGCIVARMLGSLPYICEISNFPGEEYVKMCLKQDYTDQLPLLKIE